MKLIKPVFLFIVFLPQFLLAQYKSDLKKEQWVDSVFNSLSNEEKIA